jgi:hypothetical protein
MSTFVVVKKFQTPVSLMVTGVCFKSYYWYRFHGNLVCILLITELEEK